MSERTDIWRLPGPASYVNEIATVARGGQHVAAVLPRYLADDLERGDGLAVALLDKLPRSRRVQPWLSDGKLPAALGRQMTYDDPPVTVPDLIRHPDVRGETLVCLAADLEPGHQDELADFLRRLATDSRSVAASERCTFVVITDTASLPRFAGNEAADVTLANSWFWNRVSRWDIAAHLAMQPAQARGSGVLSEVQTETIIELARWDFDLAVTLAGDWSGDRGQLAQLCGPLEVAQHSLPLSGRPGPRPPDTVMSAWEQGAVDCWHENVVLAPSRCLNEAAVFHRHVWAGQARVLLPWIEIKRGRLESTLRRLLGAERYDNAIRDFATGSFDPSSPDDVAEIGLLNKVVQARLGSSEPQVRDAARALREARNQLAHLQPLNPARLEQLVRTCDFLHG